MSTEIGPDEEAASQPGAAVGGVRFRREEGECPSVAVARALESVAGPLEPGALYDAVDPDALDRLFAGADRHGSVSFDVCGHRVEVHDGEEIVVEPGAKT